MFTTIANILHVAFKTINFYHLFNLLLLLLSRPASTLRCCSSVLPLPWCLPPPWNLHAKGSLVLLDVLQAGADNLNLASRASTSDRREEISLESSNNWLSEQMFSSLSSGSCLWPLSRVCRSLWSARDRLITDSIIASMVLSEEYFTVIAHMVLWVDLNVLSSVEGSLLMANFVTCVETILWWLTQE